MHLWRQIMDLIFTFKTVGCRFTPAKLDPCFHLISRTGSFFYKYLTAAIMLVFVAVGIFHIRLFLCYNISYFLLIYFVIQLK